MIATTSESLLEFLRFWNNEHLANEDNTVPLNMYNMSALSAGVGFTLKWFISKDDFEKIAQEVNYIFDDDETRMLLSIGEDWIELEIDKHNIISDFKEEVKDIDAVFDKIENQKTF
jgi:hypothetical protein